MRPPRPDRAILFRHLPANGWERPGEVGTHPSDNAHRRNSIPPNPRRSRDNEGHRLQAVAVGTPGAAAARTLTCAYAAGLAFSRKNL